MYIYSYQYLINRLSFKLPCVNFRHYVRNCCYWTGIFCFHQAFT